MTPVTTFPLVDAILAGRDRNLDGVILIAAQHLLQTTHAMLSATQPYRNPQCGR